MLEIGFGSGVVAAEIISRHPNITYYALDISAKFIRIAIHSLENKAIFIQGNADNLPFYNQSFDLVLEMDAIHHFPKEFISLPVREIARVLKSSGYAIFAEDWGKPVENDLEELAYSLQNRRELTNSGREYHPSDDEWLQMFHENGINRINLIHEPRPLNIKTFLECPTPEIKSDIERLRLLWGNRTPTTIMSIHIVRKQ